MVIQKGQVLRPMGDPGIATARKTGPRTDEGKLRSMISAGILNAGTQSKVLKRLRKCDKCPLGAKETKYYVNSKEKILFRPAKCQYYTSGNIKCPFGITDFANRMKIYVELEKKGWDEAEVAKALTFDALSDAAMSRQVEMVTGGQSKGYTHLHSNRALEAIKASHEMKFGKRQVVGLVDGGTSNIIVKKLFEDMDKKKVVEEVENEN